jgi:flagellar protein FlbD
LRRFFEPFILLNFSPHAPIRHSYPLMIRLTRINRIPLVINSDLIEHVEVTPDTVVSLTTGQKFMVLESADEVIDRVIRFRREIMHEAPEQRRID